MWLKVNKFVNFVSQKTLKMSITQLATITKIEDGILYLSTCSPDTCQGCKAQAACASSGGGKDIVLSDDGRGREVGDQVVLRISRSQGLRAVLIAYMIPVALIVVLLLGFQWLGISEMISACITLAVVVVYFIILRLLKNKLETELTIEIE